MLIIKSVFERENQAIFNKQIMKLFTLQAIIFLVSYQIISKLLIPKELSSIDLYLFIFLILQNLYKQIITMGCSDSNATSNQEQANTQKANGKQLRFKPQVDDGGDQFISNPNNKKQRQTMAKKAKKSKFNQIQTKIQQKPSKINKSPFVFSSPASHKQSKQKPIKVKKTNELTNKTQPDIKLQIIQNNRLQLTNQIPSIPRTGSTFQKPVIQYSPRKKGGLLPSQSQSKYISKWNVPIAHSRDSNQKLFTNNESYMSVNQSIKSPFKQHQIQMRLDDVRNEAFLQSISLRIENAFQYPLERNQSSYM